MDDDRDGPAFGSSATAARAQVACPNIMGFRVGFQFQPDTASPELELFGGSRGPAQARRAMGGARLRSERRAGRKFDRLGKHHRQSGRQPHRDLPFDLFGDGCGGQRVQPTRTVRVVDHFVELERHGGPDMIWVEPGTFTMGSPTSEAGRGSDETETRSP